MKTFFIALGFFTRLPVPKMEFTTERYGRAMKLTPLVGLVLGAILVLLALLISVLNLPALIRSAILMCAYIILTGGLHLDGLADTCDGVFSGRSRAQSLEIMKDCRIGVFGMLGIFMAGVFYFALFTLAPPAAILVFPLCGRACFLISASIAPYAREEGMGKIAGAGSGPAAVAVSLASLAGGSLLTIPFVKIPIVNQILVIEPSRGLLPAFEYNPVFPAICSLIAIAVAIIVTVCMTSHFKKKLGGVTGDTFGAVIEVSAITYLFVFTILHPVMPL